MDGLEFKPKSPPRMPLALLLPRQSMSNWISKKQARSRPRQSQPSLRKTQGFEMDSRESLIEHGKMLLRQSQNTAKSLMPTSSVDSLPLSSYVEKPTLFFSFFFSLTSFRTPSKQVAFDHNRKCINTLCGFQSFNNPHFGTTPIS
ncbi:MAG: hypothetical protein Q8P67_24275 [archaeon]|nr:hypothetical protein [archaeon]